MTDNIFKQEIAQALKAYDRFVICLDKTPEQFLESMQSLVGKALREFENRGPHQRHGIALDSYVTVIISQTEGPRPLCGIYFNLHSPYLKKTSVKPAKSLEKKAHGPRPAAEE